MNDSNRDLLVLSRYTHLREEEFDRQLVLLNKLLYEIETWDTLGAVNEIINIIRQPYLVQKALCEKGVKPFVITWNKN